MFEELDMSHGSSWQYELQQLKIANQRSYEELEVLESDRLREDTPSSSFPERIQQVLAVARGSGHCDWGRTPELCEYEGQRSLKHPWGEICMVCLLSWMVLWYYMYYCVFFLGHLYMNNHNYILLYEYTHRQIKIIFLATNHYKPSHKMCYMSQTASCKLS